MAQEQALSHKGLHIFLGGWNEEIGDGTEDGIAPNSGGGIDFGRYFHLAQGLFGTHHARPSGHGRLPSFAQGNNVAERPLLAVIQWGNAHRIAQLRLPLPNGYLILRFSDRGQIIKQVWPRSQHILRPLANRLRNRQADDPRRRWI